MGMPYVQILTCVQIWDPATNVRMETGQPWAVNQAERMRASEAAESGQQSTLALQMRQRHGFCTHHQPCKLRWYYMCSVDKHAIHSSQTGNCSQYPM